MSYVCPRCRKMGEAFPSIHAELERVTAERDAALKGYRGMREVIGEIDHSHRCDIRTDGTGCNCHMIRVKAVLTSFPEIK